MEKSLVDTVCSISIVDFASHNRIFFYIKPNLCRKPKSKLNSTRYIDFRFYFAL